MLTQETLERVIRHLKESHGRDIVLDNGTAYVLDLRPATQEDMVAFALGEHIKGKYDD